MITSRVLTYLSPGQDYPIDEEATVGGGGGCMLVHWTR